MSETEKKDQLAIALPEEVKVEVKGRTYTQTELSAYNAIRCNSLLAKAINKGSMESALLSLNVDSKTQIISLIVSALGQMDNAFDEFLSIAFDLPEHEEPVELKEGEKARTSDLDYLRNHLRLKQLGKIVTTFVAQNKEQVEDFFDQMGGISKLFNKKEETESKNKKE